MREQVRRLQSWWQPYGHLLMPILIGIAIGGWKFAVDGHRDPGWPAAAAQVLGALIVAAVLEGGLFQARNRWPETGRWRTRIMTEIMWYWPLAAVIVSVFYAARHEAFGPVLDAFVAGAIAVLLVTIGNMASLRAWDQKRPRSESAP